MVVVLAAQSHFQMSSEGGSVGWRPRTTVGFAGPGKSIAGGKCRYISASVGSPLMDGACCVSYILL